jgi:probable phosphoglycerate mutase
LLDRLKATDKTFLLVAHGGIARVVHSYFYDMTNEEYGMFKLGNCEILKYEFTD